MDMGAGAAGTALCDQVQRACHALALDDERTTFHPVLWNERHEKPAPNGEYAAKDERISQVWFAGMHSNVGGGYPDNSLAHIPLCWIMDEAQACGLKFKTNPPAEPDAMALRKAARDKDGRLYNSRSGVGGYYRYGPRKILDLCHMLLEESGRRSRDQDSEDPRKRAQTHTRRRACLRTGWPFPSNMPWSPMTVVLPAAQNRSRAPVEAKHARSAERISIWFGSAAWFTSRRVCNALSAALSAVSHIPARRRILHVIAARLRPDPARRELVPTRSSHGSSLCACSRPIPDRIGHRRRSYSAGSAVARRSPMGCAGFGYRRRRCARRPAPRADLSAFGQAVRISGCCGRSSGIIVPFAFAVLVVYLTVTFASHILFNIQDAAGWVCEESRSSTSTMPGTRTGSR